MVSFYTLLILYNKLETKQQSKEAKAKMEEPPKYEANVIVIPYPSQGYINPLLQFAKRLASKGLKATLATTPYTLNSISAANVGVEPISDGFDQSGFAQAQNKEVYLKVFKANGSKTLSTHPQVPKLKLSYQLCYLRFIYTVGPRCC